jgi:hypothetical protein
VPAGMHTQHKPAAKLGVSGSGTSSDAVLGALLCRCCAPNATLTGMP